jgi:hypothetical protein
MHVLRKRAIHRLASRVLRGPRGDMFFALAREALAKMEERDGQTRYVLDWREIMERGKDEVARTLIARNDVMDGLRDSSPFMRVWGFDLGKNMRIDLRDDETRHRLWNLSKRLVTLHPQRMEVPTWQPRIPT